VRTRSDQPRTEATNLSSAAVEPRVAVYPGAFDPVHLGHVDLARRAARLFDRLIVAVYDRPAKQLLFSAPERIAMFQQATADLANVEIAGYSGLTIDFAQRQQAQYLVRGLRAASDFEYEYQLNSMNRHLAPRLETVFLLTAMQHWFLSSSLIKEVAREGACLDGLVPEHVATALHVRLRGAS
jgi:pantetheine-phosphate adenylyltransferase